MAKKKMSKKTKYMLLGIGLVAVGAGYFIAKALKKKNDLAGVGRLYPGETPKKYFMDETIEGQYVLEALLTDNTVARVFEDPANTDLYNKKDAAYIFCEIIEDRGVFGKMKKIKENEVKPYYIRPKDLVYKENGNSYFMKSKIAYNPRSNMFYYVTD